MKTRIWLKYVLWTAIGINVLGAPAINTLERNMYNEYGRLEAFLTVLIFLFIFGLIFGSIGWLGSFLVVSKRKDILWSHLLRLFFIVILLACLGNLATLIICGLLRLIERKIGKNHFSGDKGGVL